MKFLEISKPLVTTILTESLLEADGKNTHLEHLEDNIFNKGHEGAKEAVDYLYSLHQMLEGNTKTPVSMTTKWDGAPAIVAGKDPQTGKFFVGTKGVFAKNPKMNFTNSDIEKYHADQGDKDASGLRNKLKLALKHLSRLNWDTVAQGDMLFAGPGDIKEQVIDGEQYIVFKPNTIVYAVPKNSDLAKEILSSNIGIVFHTEYVGGPTLADMNAKFGYDASALGDGSNAGVWYRDAIIKDYSGQVTMTADESAMLKSAIEDANKNLSKMGNLEFLKNNEFGQNLRERIKTSVNKIIKDQGQFEKDPTAFATAFITDYKSVMKKAIEGVKLDKTKVAKTKLMLDGIKFLEDNTPEIVSAYVVYLDLIRAKEMIVKKLANVKQIDTFVQNAEGDYDVTGEEGFVAVDHIGNAIKLVDRLDFSLKNFGSGRPGA